MTHALIIAALILLALYLFIFVYLDGENLKKYDNHGHEVTFNPPEPSAGQADVLEHLEVNFTAPGRSRNDTIHDKRERFEAGARDREFDCEHRQDSFGDLDGEWTLIDGADPNKRLLYIHGGAFAAGSAISHRPITYNIAKRTGCAVFAVNYRLIPENKRLDCPADSKAAYRWICENGPDGPAPAETIAVAGDSAGGNLTLVVSRWASADSAIKTPDAIIAISPTVDSTMSAPSIKRNYETDIMLKPLVGPLLKAPRSLLLLGAWITTRCRPSAPILSPIMGDLSSLPPTLIQVSSAEILYDDACRYQEKAKRAGSNVKLQSWAHMAHVWPIFDNLLPEAQHAFDEMAAFLKDHNASAK
ncbi:MAG: alpha/beta hydrolase [Maricaulaceae bacterium]